MHNLNLLNKPVFYISFPLYFVNFMFPILAVEYGATSLQLGTMFSILSLIAIFTKPIIGYFVDLRGSKKSFIIGAIIYSLSLIILYKCNSYEMLLSSSILSSIALSFVWISCDSFVINNSSDESTSQNFGKIDQWSSKGGFIGSLIGYNLFFMNFFNDFRTIFLIYTVVVLIALFYAARLIPTSTKAISKNSDSDRIKIFSFKDIKSLSSEVKFFLVIIFIGSIGGSMFAPVFLSYINEYITSDYMSISYLYVPGSILSMILPYKLGKIIDKRNKGNIIIGSIIFNIIYWVIFPFTKSFDLLLVIFTLSGVVGMCSGLASSSIKKLLFGNKTVGYKVGILGLASGLGASIGSFIGGALYGIGGIYSVVALKIIFSIAVLLMYLIFFKRTSYNEVSLKSE